jgi:general secretion pathway protein A
MLLNHFNLSVQPFGATPDARFLYLSQTHREAAASLYYGLHAGRGFAALIAPPGMGKTTLLFRLLDLLKGTTQTAFLFQTLCGPEEFLRSLLADLGLDAGGNIGQMQSELNAHLLQLYRSGCRAVVVIDEAQNLEPSVLEVVRMLSNFETPGKKLLQIVLSGQPQLADKLASDSLIQLRQRISIVAKLAPFDVEDTRKYIEHRVRVGGLSSGNSLFTKQAYALIAEHSHGIPRNINNLCFNSLSLACATRKPEVDVSMVRETIRDLDLTTIGTRSTSAKRVVKAESALRPSLFQRAAAHFSAWRKAPAPVPGSLMLSVAPNQHAAQGEPR